MNNPEIEQFMKARSRAIGAHYLAFVRARGLEYGQDDTWPAKDRAEFKAESDALQAEWERKAAELPDSPEPPR